MQKVTKKPNRLIKEKSPYLLQHAYNPVDWYPWGNEAFERAKELDKPIFLSIGYSTCHWCHVMEKESFEDAEVAKLLNDTFICIKVDKEERPDIDNTYITIAQITTGSAGWPLNIVITPNKKPFYIDTYIPKHNKFMKLGMLDLIPKIQNLWLNERGRVLTSSENIVQALKELQENTLEPAPEKKILDIAFKELRSQFDKEYGGFGNSPKFPTPHNLIFLLRYWKSTGNEEALEMVEKTLKAIRYGGIYDHIGQGVHRYATNRSWLIPHFEKMLYDQALLSLAYTEAFEATKNEFYKQTSEEILSYVLRDLTSPEGGFYAGEDADSQGVEGKYYLWQTSELEQLLTNSEFELFIASYNIEPKGNYEDETTRNYDRSNIPHLKLPVPTHNQIKINAILSKLFAHREKRVHPHKDDKVLTDWNGLMIAALAKASRVFNKPVYLKAALKSLEFTKTKLMQGDNILLHDYRDNRTSNISFLDDYAFMIFGLIELYEADFNSTHIDLALKLNKTLIDHYWDNSSGGFFFTADNNETVLIRKKETYDGAIPSGNSIEMINLLNLAIITDNYKLEEYAFDISKVFANKIEQHPAAYTMLLTAFNSALNPPCKIVLSPPDDNSMPVEMLDEINKHYLPNKIILLRNRNKNFLHLKEFNAIDNKPTVYLCINNTCKEPVNNIDAIKDLLKDV